MNKCLPHKISVIVTTRNWPYALRAVLNALADQKTTHPFEIIVADDGSGDETAKLIRQLKSRLSIPLLHIWQPDQGCRTVTIRNKAILAAEGDYILFLEGNCIPRENFITSHLALAKVNTFVVGNRILLSQEFTLSALSKALALHQWSFWRWSVAWVLGYCNRLFSFKAYILGVWKSDLLQVNGWEENVVAWEYQDLDLSMRLLRNGIKRKRGGFQIPIIHLWYPENDPSQKKENGKLLETRKRNQVLCAEKGLNQYEF